MLQCFWQRERNKYETKSIRLRLQTLISFIFLLLFYKKHGFIEEDKPSENVVIVEEELNRFFQFLMIIFSHNQQLETITVIVVIMFSH